MVSLVSRFVGSRGKSSKMFVTKEHHHGVLLIFSPSGGKVNMLPEIIAVVWKV